MTHSLGRGRQAQARGAAVLRVDAALEQPGAGELLDERADGIGGDAELGGGFVDADAGAAVEQAQQLTFGLGDVEGFAGGAGVVAQAAADAGQDSGQLRGKRAWRQAAEGSTRVEDMSICDRHITRSVSASCR